MKIKEGNQQQTKLNKNGLQQRVPLLAVGLQRSALLVTLCTWPSTEIPKIAIIFRAFFPATCYTQIGDNSPKNYLVELLQYRNESLFKSIYEIYRILKYYLKHPDKDSIRLKNNKGQVNSNEFRERLFELYVNMLFNENQLSPRIDKKYLIDNLVTKLIDSALKFSGEEYLIEYAMMRIEKVSSFNNLCVNIHKRNHHP